MIAEADGGRGMVTVAVRALALGLPLSGLALARLCRSRLAGSQLAGLGLRSRARRTGLPLGAALASLPRFARLDRLGVHRARLLGVPAPIGSRLGT